WKPLEADSPGRTVAFHGMSNFRFCPLLELFKGSSGFTIGRRHLRPTSLPHSYFGSIIFARARDCQRPTRSSLDLAWGETKRGRAETSGITLSRCVTHGACRRAAQQLPGEATQLPFWHVPGPSSS